ncbi:MAG: O-Antigen ligase [Rhodocyclaceae bacterium]|nr:MAG: O-Antigen ligase [Rhodocyclaceae bacterium]
MSSIVGSRYIAPIAMKEQHVNWPVVLYFFFLTVASLLGAVPITVFMLLFMFLVLCCWIPMRGGLPPLLGNLLLPFSALLLVGSLGIYENPKYDVFKDVWYVGKPMLCMTVGFVLMWNLRDLRRLLRIFVVVGAVVSVFHIIRFIQNPDLLSLSANDMRNAAGRGYIIAVIGIGAWLAAWKLNFRLFPFGRLIDTILLLLCLASIGLSMSRVMFLSFLLLVGAVLGIVNFTDRKKVTKIVVAVVIGFIVLMLIPKPQYVGQNATFLEKMLFSLQEMEVRDYNSIADINTRWRGYETARAYLTYSNGAYWQYLTGRGFGTSVDLGLFMPMGDEPIRFAPILHNGYMYLLVKTGLMGILIYLFFLASVIRTGNECIRQEGGGSHESRYTGRLIVGVACVLGVSTFVVSGPFNKQAMIPAEIFLGALVAHAARRTFPNRSVTFERVIQPSPSSPSVVSKGMK